MTNMVFSAVFEALPNCDGSLTSLTMGKRNKKIEKISWMPRALLL